MDESSVPPAVEPAMDARDWRAQIPPGSRDRILSKIMDRVNGHLPVSGEEGLEVLKKFVVRFEEKFYSTAISQSDYLRKITRLIIAIIKHKYNNAMPNHLPSTSVGNCTVPPLNPGAVATLCTNCKRRVQDDCELYIKAATSIKKAKNDQEAGEFAELAPTPKEPSFSCPVCLGDLIEPTSTRCGHIFCKECLKNSLKSMQNKCPTCRQKVGRRGTFRVYLPATK